MFLFDKIEVSTRVIVMRNFLSLLIFLYVFGCGGPANLDDLVLKDDVYYTKHSTTPYSGPAVSKMANGEKHLEGMIQDGRKHGVWTQWFEDKNDYRKLDGSKQQLTYENGVRHGSWIKWNSKGEKEWEETYKDGKYHGVYTSWFPDGQKELEEHHKEGKRHGMYTRWYENGQKKYEAMYKDGLRDGITNRWFENGQQQLESMYKEDKLLDDSYKRWSPEGELIKGGPKTTETTE